MHTTPPDLGTRQNAISLKLSTIDLTFMSPHLGSTTTRGPSIGSDHLPINLTINTKISLPVKKPPSWNFSEANWTTWNATLNETISNSNFYETKNPKAAFEIIQNAFTTANEKSSITLNKPTRMISREPPQIWWNTDCKKAVGEARKARNACNPKSGGILCDSNRKAWREKENRKNRIILKAKQQALQKHIHEVIPKSSSTKTWAFAKAWTNGAQPPDLNSSPIKNPSTNQLSTQPKEKVEIFATHFDHQATETPDREDYEEAIITKISSEEPCGLNSKITTKELEFGMSNLKRQAMGRDLIHNNMLKNLKEQNKNHILHLFNTLLESSYVLGIISE
jgi:hypothetical protein